MNHASVCSQTCEDRCFGRDPNQCCHPECAAGCRGPKKTDCYVSQLCCTFIYSIMEFSHKFTDIMLLKFETETQEILHAIY